MTVAESATGILAEPEHRVQLRRAVIASTIGTTIEWYDFLLYGQVTGRHACGVCDLWRRLCRPSDRGGDLRPLGRPHRPQGDPDRDVADNRPCHVRGRPRSELRKHRHLGRNHHDLVALYSGRRGRRRMERFGIAGDGMGENQR